MALSSAWLPALLVVLWAWVLRRRPHTAHSTRVRRSAIVLVVLLSGRYLLWRATSTLNLVSAEATALSLLLLAAEVILVGHGVLQLGLAWFRQPPIAEEVHQAAQRLEHQIRCESRRLARVDVVVPSRGEPLEVLERSLRGYLALEYPRVAVWLPDDAARPELADLCRRLGCRYFSRTDGRHAKAGNLNHALPHLHGDLLLVFDADVLPQRHFLTRTVGLFDDPRVALVQTPQSYMNPDPVSRNLGLERWLMPERRCSIGGLNPPARGWVPWCVPAPPSWCGGLPSSRLAALKPAPPPRTWRRGSASARRATASCISTRNSAPAWPRPAWRRWRVSAAAGQAARSRRCEPRRILWSSRASTPCSGWPCSRASSTGST
jgi:hypothetical protein